MVFLFLLHAGAAKRAAKRIEHFEEGERYGGSDRSRLYLEKWRDRPMGGGKVTSVLSFYKALAERAPEMQFIVITGRNIKLFANLEKVIEETGQYFRFRTPQPHGSVPR